MENQKLLSDKVLELFVTKNRVAEPTVIAIWAKRLQGKFPIHYTLKAIENLIWGGDDWPTLAKIAEEVYDVVKLEYVLLDGAKKAEIDQDTYVVKQLNMRGNQIENKKEGS